MNKNLYMKNYMLNRYHQRRSEAINFLGTKCVRCESAQDLELDHIEKDKKGFAVSRLWSCKKSVFWEEISKCQLLCNSCHKKKTRDDFGQNDARVIHGTVSSYRYCKCDRCKEAKRQYYKKWKEKRGS